jgi:hypothetical protein
MDKQLNMESDEGSKQKKTSNLVVDGSDVLPPSGVRCSIFHAPKTRGFLFDYHFIFLPIVSGFLWLIYFII